jgi:hypothetical protein
MAFKRTRISNLAKEQIRNRALPDNILKEVYLHLTEVLSKDPEHYLSRAGGLRYNPLLEVATAMLLTA